MTDLSLIAENLQGLVLYGELALFAYVVGRGSPNVSSILLQTYWLGAYLASLSTSLIALTFFSFTGLAVIAMTIASMMVYGLDHNHTPSESP